MFLEYTQDTEEDTMMSKRHTHTTNIPFKGRGVEWGVVSYIDN